MTRDTVPWLAALTAVAAGSITVYLISRLSYRKRRKEMKMLLGDGNNDSQLSSLRLQQQQRETDRCIYLDYNGTTPIHPKVVATMLPYLTLHFGNPSSSHFYGTAPKQAVQHARKALLTLLQAHPKEEPLSSICFTGCGTESDNLAIELALLSNSSKSRRQKLHIVTSNVEHPAIDVCLRSIEARNENVQVTFVPVQPDGRVRVEDVVAALRPTTVLVTIMLANNESGALQPIRDVMRTCRERNILCHTDAAQAVGKVDVSLEAMGYPDMVTIVGHKIGAPKGVAALYVRDGCCHEHGRSLADGGILLLGGGQEFGRRGGTENVPYIAGLGRAAELCVQERKQNATHMNAMRHRLLDNLTKALGDDRVRPNGPTDLSLRLPNTLSVGLKDVHSGELLKSIQHQVAASAGAACHSQGSGVSAVLEAMKVPPEFAAGTLRLSVGPKSTPEEIDKAARIIATEAQRQFSSKKL